MNNQTKRTETYTKALARFIRKEYQLEEVSLTPARRGFFGETWQLKDGEKRYFAKLIYFPEYQHTYAQSFEIIDFLCRKGIDFISTIVKASDGRLFTCFDGAVLGVFNWIDGENVETNETKIFEYQMLAKIYAIPIDGIEVRKEDFSGKSAALFYEQWAAVKDEEILSLLAENRDKLEYRAGRLQYFADLCIADTSGFYLTHGDAGGNFFVNGYRHFLIDWDDVLLAPPERDAWVMGFNGWARCLFQKALRQNGIEYTLKPERLAYYCYYMFFFWLTWLVKCSNGKEIENFFQVYGDERIEYADELWKQSLDIPPTYERR